MKRKAIQKLYCDLDMIGPAIMEERRNGSQSKAASLEAEEKRIVETLAKVDPGHHLDPNA